MNPQDLQTHLASYWSGRELATNALVFMNLLGALLLGSLVGYERAYHGRAAGMRTYGLVCMASAGLTVFAGYPGLWFGGNHLFAGITPDPTRVVQGIVTGIGFLGAGVIVKEGLSISGLTTAASIWATSCIGVLIGVGFYASAILLAVLSAATMMWGSRFENWLPSHPAVGLTLGFDSDHAPQMVELSAFVARHGYELAKGSLTISGGGNGHQWRLVIVVKERGTAATLDQLAHALAQLPGLQSYSVGHARN
jgi:putative Mg2+ transporter-C (MgtC) family protein